MARKAEASSQSRKRSWASALGVLSRFAVWGGVVVGGLYGFHRAEQYLVRNPRFTLVAPDYGLESPSLEIEGIRFASRMQILRIFSADFGRSVYLVPLAQRRSQLRALDWVKDASISRVWPNRVLVRIEEREPVAYLQVPVDRFSRVALIDPEGVILQPPANTPFALPVVTGIRPREADAVRREKMRRVMFLLRDVGSLSERISEVDVSDMDNLKVTAKAGDRAMALLMGEGNFGARLQNFVNHYADIQRRLPGATTLDLRLDDRITAVEEHR